MSRELKTLEIRVNGYIAHVESYDGNICFRKGTLESHLIESIQSLHDVIRAEDFSRNDGKRPDVCPACSAEIEEAGKKELPPYRDWECTFCSMNGHDGRFNLKDK
jgi:hypothetical protein